MSTKGEALFHFVAAISCTFAACIGNFAWIDTAAITLAVGNGLAFLRPKL